MKKLRLGDEAACARLLIRSAYCADRHDIEGYLALFSFDAVLHVRGKLFRGLDGIRGFLQGRDPNRVTRHVLAPPIIQIADDQQASGLAYFTLFDGINPVPGEALPARLPATIGEFKQAYRRESDRWAICSHESIGIFRRAEG